VLVLAARLHARRARRARRQRAAQARQDVAPARRRRERRDRLLSTRPAFLYGLGLRALRALQRRLSAMGQKLDLLIGKVRGEKGPFFMARLCLRLGFSIEPGDVPDNEPNERALLDACRSLGYDIPAAFMQTLLDIDDLPHGPPRRRLP